MKYEVHQTSQGFKIQQIVDDRVVLQLSLSREEGVALGAGLINTPEVFDNAFAVDTVKEIAAALPGGVS